MKASEFRKLIREEIAKEAKMSPSTKELQDLVHKMMTPPPDNRTDQQKLAAKAADLYAYTGGKTSYDSDDVKRYGQETVDLAKKMGPKIEAYKRKLKTIVAELEKSPEMQMLMSIMDANTAYGGGRGRATIGKIIDQFSSAKPPEGSSY